MSRHFSWLEFANSFKSNLIQQPYTGDKRKDDGRSKRFGGGPGSTKHRKARRFARVYGRRMRGGR